MLKAVIIISYDVNRGANGRHGRLILGQLVVPESLSVRHQFWTDLHFFFLFASVALQRQCHFRHVPLLTLKGSIAFWRVFRGHCTVWILIITMLPLPDRCQSSRHGNGTIRHLLLTRPPPHPLPAPKGKKKKKKKKHRWLFKVLGGHQVSTACFSTQCSHLTSVGHTLV